MASDEKTTFGATIVPPAATHPPALHPDMASDTHTSHSPEPNSRSSTPPSVLRPTAPASTLHPNSPYYNDPSSGNSTPVKGTSHSHLSPSDLEAGMQPMSQFSTATHSQTKFNRPSVDGHITECTAWPTKQTLMEKALAAKTERQCCPWFGRLTKQQKLIVKILIALLVVAAAVGIGIGVSRAVGGGVWTGTNESSDIPE